MSKLGFSFGLNATKKPGANKPRPAASAAIFAADDDDDFGNGHNKEAEIGEDIGGELDLSAPAVTQEASSGKPRTKNKVSAQAPRLNSKPGHAPQSGDGPMTLEAWKQAEAAQELDPTIYEYDTVYDALKPKKHATNEEAERRSKYMRGLMQAAEVRKRDALIAEEKKIARERVAEGDEYADKEKFVTEAYKNRQEENRRLEDEERHREKEDAKKNQGGGMSAFYRRLLDKGEERHAEILKATRESAKDGPKTVEDHNEDYDRDSAAAALARELNAKGANVAVNEDGEVVDKRELLKGGLNLGAKKHANPARAAEQPRERPQHHANNSQTARRQGMRERQSRMLEEQLEESLKRTREAEEAERHDMEQAAKSRKTDGEKSSAKERYLARKRAAEEAKRKGLTE